ncbi:MAG: tRNA (N6-threonylcarbamoyladenosine(37)-N6)-methyltransferase TrmO [Chloroflexi bacterium]|nr:tRNA (N6-threonylcarbamoyladenosine(37)-N6)-methyltransferase TrmO [Chloroflexota bacterium]
MDQKNIIFQPIGWIQSPFQDLVDMPIQPSAAAGIKGNIVLDPVFQKGLKDLDGFSHLILIYQFHRSKGFDLQLKPFLDDQKHGVFATRAPRRPNGIGFSVVKLLAVRGNTLEIENVDILDGTPLLDIKPYVPGFDHPGSTQIGWLEDKREKIKEKRSDDRFRK